MINILLSFIRLLSSFNPLVNSKILLISKLFILLKLNKSIIIVDITKNTDSVPKISKRLSIELLIDLVKIIPNFLGLFFWLFMI